MAINDTLKGTSLWPNFTVDKNQFGGSIFGNVVNNDASNNLSNNYPHQTVPDATPILDGSINFLINNGNVDPGLAELVSLGIRAIMLKTLEYPVRASYIDEAPIKLPAEDVEFGAIKEKTFFARLTTLSNLATPFREGMTKAPGSVIGMEGTWIKQFRLTKMFEATDLFIRNVGQLTQGGVNLGSIIRQMTEGFRQLNNKVAREVLYTQSTKVYAGNAKNVDEVDTNGIGMRTDDFTNIQYKFYKDLVDPINGAYTVIASPEIYQSLKADPEFTFRETIQETQNSVYSTLTKQDPLVIPGFRIVTDYQSKEVYTKTGQKVNVALIFGAEAYAVVGGDGGAKNVFITPPGGQTDPFHQFWKVAMVGNLFGISAIRSEALISFHFPDARRTNLLPSKRWVISHASKVEDIDPDTGASKTAKLKALQQTYFPDDGSKDRFKLESSAGFDIREVLGTPNQWADHFFRDSNYLAARKGGTVVRLENPAGFTVAAAKLEAKQLVFDVSALDKKATVIDVYNMLINANRWGAPVTFKDGRKEILMDLAQVTRLTPSAALQKDMTEAKPIWTGDEKTGYTLAVKSVTVNLVNAYDPKDILENVAITLQTEPNKDLGRKPMPDDGDGGGSAGGSGKRGK